MRCVPVTVDSFLRLDGNLVGHDLASQIFDELTVPNPEYELALKRNSYLASELPSDFLLAELAGDTLVLARGYALQLKLLLREHDLGAQWVDRRRFHRGAPLGHDEFSYRAHQPAAVKAIRRHQQLIYKAPTGCVAGDTMLRFNRAGRGFQMSIADAYRKFNGIKAGTCGPSWRSDIPTYCRALVDDVFLQHRVEDIVCSGTKPTIKITLESGKQIRCTREHGVLSDDGWLPAGKLAVDDWVMVNGIKKGAKYVPAPQGHPRAIMVGHRSAPTHGYVLESVLVAERKYQRPILLTEHVHHRDENSLNNDSSNLEVLTPSEHNTVHRRFRNMDGGTAGTGGEIIFLPKYERVISIEFAGLCMTYDMVMEDPHNNFVANGIVVHNSGKTVTVCGAIWEMSPQRSIILVNRINLVDQWMDRIEEHIGIPRSEIGSIGDKSWTEGRVTVATVQTLHRYIEYLRQEDWFAQWDFMCLDECHHVTARTFLELVNEFPARIRMGTSATPDKTGAFGLALNSLGEVAYETTHEELRSYNLLVTPKVEVVPTPFEFTYWGNHKSTKKGQCEVPDCPRAGKQHGHRNNYMKLNASIATDVRRNRVIVEKIVDNIGETQLVLTDRLAQIDALVELLEAHPIYGHDQGIGPEDVLVLTGQMKREEKAAVIEAVASQVGAILFSTIAGEALDIPIISRIHLVFPTRNPRKTEQNVGRGTRSHDAKTDTIIYDYADFNVGLLVSQYKTRRNQCYIPLGFEIHAPPIEQQNGKRATLGSGRMKV